ncbi:MAG: phospholipase D family protein [Rhodospirillaceae bacterium]|nr:MAG: phospholipase D family protein [Rhodospirillaceae bacterium]
MLTIRFAFALFVAVAASWSSTVSAGATQAITPCFTPGGACTQLIVNAISSAKHDIRVQAYSFTSAPIAKALADAHRRGVDVKVILDKSQATAKYTGATYLQNAGVPVAIDYKVAIAHNKVMVIDGSTVITGSFNFTKAAQERNAENLLVIRDAELARQYLANWQSRAAVSKPYKRK